MSAVLLALAIVTNVAAPASAFLDKTRFLAHVGVAYFSFHHFVLKPYQEHRFDEGTPHRTSTMIKGGIALLFAVHEAQVAEKIAHNSPDPLLQKLDGGLMALAGSFGAIGAKLKSGHFSPDDIKGLEDSTRSLASTAAAGGSPIKDVPAAIPGT